MQSKSKIWIGITFLALFLLIALLPIVASTKWGFKVASRFVPGKMSAKSAHLSWLGSQHIEGFRYKGPDSTLTFDAFSTDSSLLTLILTQRAADTKLINPKLTLDTASLENKSKKSKAFYLPFKGGAVIQNGTLAFKRKNTIFAQFKQINVNLNVDENALPITLIATGKTLAGSATGGFNITGRIYSQKENSDLSKWLTKKLGLPSNTPLAYELRADLQNVPLAGWLADSLGPMLSAKAELSASQETNDLALSAHSKTLSADLHAIAPEDSIEVKPGSTLSYQLTPNFWQTLYPKHPILQPIKADMRLISASIPINAWQNASGKGSINLTDGLADGITISRANVQFDTADLSRALDVNLTSTVNANGKLDASFTWQQPLNGLPSIYSILTTLKLTAVNLPMAPLSLSDIIGPTLNLSAISESDELDITASSSKLNTNHLNFKINPESLQLAKPATVRYTLSHPHLAAQTPITIQLSQLILPENIDQMHMQASIASTQATLDQLQLADTNISVKAKTLSDIKYSLMSRLSFTNGVYKELLDPTLSLSGTGVADLKDKTATLNLIATGKSSEFKIIAALNDDLFILKKPIEVKTTLTKKAFNQLKPEALSRLHLTKATPIYFELAPFSIQLPALTWQSAAQITLSAPTLQLKSTVPFTLADFDATITLAKDTMGIESNADLNNGSYDLNLIINKADQTIQNASINCQNISSSIIDSILVESQNLQQRLGNSFDVQLTIDPDRYKIDLNSPRLTLNGAFKIDSNDRITSYSGPVLASYALSQQQIENFTTEPSKINLKIDAFKAPLKTKPTLAAPIPTIDWDWRHILIDARASSDQIRISQNKISAALYNLSAHIDRSDSSEPLEFELSSSVQMQKNAKAKQRTGSIQLSGHLSDFYSDQGKFSAQNLSTELSGQIKNLPTLFYSDAQALFGDTVSASLSAQIHNMNGTLYCDVTSPHTNFKLDSYIANGHLHLRAPLNANLTLTPALSNLLLSDARLVALSAQKPIQLHIDPKNVSIPIRNFNWQNVRIGAARLDFGKIIVASQGSAADLIEIFKIRRPNQITLWFAPMDFSIKNGKMAISRTEILYDAAYQIAIWGRINFPRRYVDMTLGLTAQSLYRSLGLRLPPSYVLTIDVEGPFGNVQIDKGDAIAKIALIIADQSGLAPQQGIPGTVFDIIQGFAHDQSDVPPPRPPYPWSR